MKALCGLIAMSIIIFSAGCGSAESKKDPTVKGARADSGVTVKDENFKFNEIKKVILYNEMDDEESNAVIFGIAGALQKKGIETSIDTGASMDYDGESFRIRTYKNLMSVYLNLVILKPGEKKGSETIIAEVKADSVQKLVETTIDFIFKATLPDSQP